MKTRFVLTHVDKNGMRTLAVPNQARHHYDRREDAEQAVTVLAPSLQEKLGMRDIQVRPANCYDTGDAISVWFD